MLITAAAFPDFWDIATLHLGCSNHVIFCPDPKKETLNTGNMGYSDRLKPILHVNLFTHTIYFWGQL